MAPKTGRTTRLRWARSRRLMWTASALVFTVSLWTAASRGSWAGSALLALAVHLVFEGMSAPAAQPWWFRRPAEVLVLPAAASAVRWPGLRAGGTGWAVLGAVALATVATILVRDRRHRWGSGPQRPFERFPLRGQWYVVQGGGRRLNHHFDVSAQRGAIDLVRTGPAGTHTGDGLSVQDFLAYGQEVVAPCHGTVQHAVDGLADQTPGDARRAPPYGNHVVIDTGSETVLLAHLRPGTVSVSSGDQVRAGQLLGQVGNSGNSTEPHLHLQAERDGAGLDLRFAGLRDGFYRGRTVRA